MIQILELNRLNSVQTSRDEMATALLTVCFKLSKKVPEEINDNCCSVIQNVEESMAIYYNLIHVMNINEKAQIARSMCVGNNCTFLIAECKIALGLVVNIEEIEADKEKLPPNY